jgi:hypothetical protein
MKRRTVALLVSACAALLGAGACGPSFQVVYEGDARFEHCYAIDDTPTIAMQEKTDCWTEWTKSYTYGQTRNRIDYALTRAKALQEVPGAPTDEAIMSAAPGGGSTRVLGQDEPVTTNAFATPPKTMSEGDGGLEASAPEKTSMEAIAVAPSKVATAPIAPSETCTERCHATWQGCEAACKGGVCKLCDRSYNGCMKRCF